MKQIKCSKRLLSLLIGSFLALQSGAAQTATSEEEELLMFVEVSKPKPALRAAQPVKTMSADEMAKMLAARTQSAPVQPAAVPLTNTALAPVAKAPVINTPAVSKAPIIVTQVPATPLATATNRTEAERSSLSSAELPIFKPATPASVAATLTQPDEPALTPEPRLSVARAPQTVARVSPGEMELRNIFYSAVMSALQRSPQVRSTQLQIDAAKEDVSNAKGQRWPQVDVTSNSRRYEFGKGNRNANDSNMPALGVNVATNLIDFGQTSNTIKSKEFSVQAADFQNTAQIEDLAWQVSSGLVELSKQRLIIEMSKQYVARMQELVTMLTGIVEADQGRRSELTQAKGRFLQAQSALDNAVSKARDTEIQLYRLLGETQVPLPPAMQWQLQPSQLDALLASVDKHPTLLKAQAQSQAAFAEADALKSSSLPKINWVVSKDTGKDYYGREQAWQTGINVSWGLFRGGSANAAEQAAVQRASAMREESENQRDDLQQRVRAADQDARSMLQRADLYRNLTRESDRIRLDFFDQWYHLGKRTLLDVLSAESDYYNNRVGEVTNRFDGYSAIFRGYASAGQLMNWLKKTPQKP
ncbi:MULTISPECIES: TolC family protein [unclassified Enterobacter]|uniref:TolC family protein n=1 Tax=unclassified Enterobacter TaxID=2608935 RepID=UPI0015C8ED72|nr:MULTISPECIES: TolC family protein [unclassified Enterobacter]MBB3307165.1 adhesin transport system outer membrane protein [Enterobacter sp. Sphag1F]NYI16230.1 adhesin transport system outer membrane protein [Enterobacter sp. Sphag71]